VSEEHNPLERAVDLFVYAPIGVAMFAKDTVPTFLKMFVSRGQTELESRKKSLHDHANQYRTVGKFAVKYGGPVVKQQAEEKLGGARRLAEETFSGLIVSRGGADDTPAAAATAATEKITADSAAKADARATAVVNGATNGKADGKAVDAAPTNGTNGKVASMKPAPVHVAPALAIPEYDQLSASQVVERLDGLTPDELDAVRAYEVAHRGRSTILGKITQLTG
jgi:hypothetical protein